MSAEWLPTLPMVAGLLVFSFFVSAMNAFLFSDALVWPLRLLIHFLALMLGFYLCFLRWGGYLKNGGSVGIGLLVFLFLYLLVGAIVFLFRWLTADLRAKEEAYENQFDAADGSADGRRG